MDIISPLKMHPHPFDTHYHNHHHDFQSENATTQDFCYACSNSHKSNYLRLLNSHFAMPRGSKDSKSPSSFALLAARGLRIQSIVNDGNCLFSALADQFFGDASRHAEIRQAAVDFERLHPDDFRPYVQPRTSSRPKRKNHNDLNRAGPTEAELQSRWNHHITELSKPGNWGGHLEIAAICRAYGVHIYIYLAHQMEPQKHCLWNGDVPRTDIPVANIAFDAEAAHYSSVRVVDAEHQGVLLVDTDSSGPPSADSQCADCLQDPLGREYAVMMQRSRSFSPLSSDASTPASIPRDDDSDDDDVLPAGSQKRTRASQESEKKNAPEGNAEAGSSQESLTEAISSVELPESQVKAEPTTAPRPRRLLPRRHKQAAHTNSEDNS